MSTDVYTHIHRYSYTYIYICICIYIYFYTYTYTRIHIHVHTYTYAYSYAFTYSHTYTYTPDFVIIEIRRFFIIEIMGENARQAANLQGTRGLLRQVPGGFLIRRCGLFFLFGEGCAIFSRAGRALRGSLRNMIFPMLLFVELLGLRV